MTTTIIRSLCFWSVAAVLTGCVATDEEAVTMKVDFSGHDEFRSGTAFTFTDGNFYHNGFPTDWRRTSDGRIDITDFPRRGHGLTRRLSDSVTESVSVGGYHTVLPVYIPFTDELDPSRLPSRDTDYTAYDAPVQLVDIDPDSPEYGRHFPLQVEINEQADTYRPEHLLQLMPTLGISLLPNTTYAAVVLDSMRTRSGAPLVAHPELSAVLFGARAYAGIPQKAFDVYQPLRQFLATHGVDPGIIVAATVWTTGDPARRLRAGANAARQLPLRAATKLSRKKKFDDYCVIEGRMDVPVYQDGNPPFWFSGGDIQFQSNGTPVVKTVRNTDFIVTIPTQTEMPAVGYPILHFHHGAGGEANQTWQRGPESMSGYDDGGNGPSRIAAGRGWASSGVSGHLSEAHLGDLEGGGAFAYDITQDEVMRNNYFQMVWERVYFRYWLENLKIPASLCPEANPGGQDYFSFDGQHQVVMGQSLGNWTAGLQVVADPKPLQGTIFSGTAGTWIRLYSREGLVSLTTAIGAAGLLGTENLDDFSPFLALVEWGLGEVDPVAMLSSLLRQPRLPAPHVLAISGIDDQGGDELVQRPFLMAVGLDLAGNEVGSTDATTLMPHMTIEGARKIPYPVSANRWVPDQGFRTAVVVRYENTVRSDHNGHHVTYDLEAPKHQYGCFLEQLAANRVPIVDKGWTINGPCL